MASPGSGLAPWAGAGVAVLLGAALVLSADGEGPSATSGDTVVVELFTSQGCSSCPPADRLLSRLAADEGSRVVPLAFHVDYWNHIGWTDPFSSPDWSERQRRYAGALGSGRVYTPQLVVNGRSECVGSDEDAVAGRIERAAAAPAAGEVGLTLRPGDRVLRLDVTVRARAGAPGGRWDALVAVFETDLVTPVKRGENGGRTLRNSNVVRRLQRAFSFDARAEAVRSGALEIALDPAWDRRHLGVAVFLQDPGSLHIHGAAVRYLGDS